MVCICKECKYTLFISIAFIHIFLLEFTSCKATKPLQGMTLQEKEKQKDQSMYINRILPL